MEISRRRLAAVFAGSGAVGAAGAAVAAEGHAQDGGITLLPAGSALAAEVHSFHNWVLMPVMVGISLFVLALLLYVMVRYNQKANPVARRFSHNTLVEIVWTGVPILILLFIALFSFDLLYKEDVMPDGRQVVVQADGGATTVVFPNDFTAKRKVTRPKHLDVIVENANGAEKLAYRTGFTVEGLGEEEVVVTLNETPPAGSNVIVRGGRSRVGPTKVLGLFGEDRTEIATAPTVTIKVSGYQWGWSYSYPDFGDFEITSNMLPENETTPELYRLAVDNPVYIPAGETIRITTTARDVIHSWALPNFAIKVDAVPGRINETWFKADVENTYYGQCSEICGIKHAFMPIEVRAVSREEFMAWVNEQRELNGMEPMAAAPAQPAVKTAAARLGETQ
ncbi:MAG: cytochrome c oxidase subunit II transmembrane domain-containing protein [Pseudomonadota bacterium]